MCEPSYDFDAFRVDADLTVVCYGYRNPEDVAESAAAEPDVIFFLDDDTIESFDDWDPMDCENICDDF